MPDRMPVIVHHGAVTGTTGSCHRLQLDAEHAILIDCGLFQGAETTGADESDRKRIDFPVDDIRALVHGILGDGLTTMAAARGHNLQVTIGNAAHG